MKELLSKMIEWRENHKNENWENETTMNNKEKYDNWVQSVCAFLAEEGPKLNKHCASFQSKPILDKTT